MQKPKRSAQRAFYFRFYPSKAPCSRKPVNGSFDFHSYRSNQISGSYQMAGAEMTGRISRSCGFDSLHLSQATGQRRAKLQPFGVLIGLGTSPKESGGASALLHSGSESRTAGKQSLSTDAACVRIQIVGRSELNDIAEVHNGNTVLMYPTMLMVMRNEEERQSSCCWRSCSRLMIWDWMETSSAEIGSSHR